MSESDDFAAFAVVMRAHAAQLHAAGIETAVQAVKHIEAAQGRSASGNVGRKKLSGDGAHAVNSRTGWQLLSSAA